MHERIAGLLGRSTTYSSQIEDAGASLLGVAWGGVHAADTLPEAPAQQLTCRVVNTASTNDGTGGVHWMACVELNGQRYFNDSLGTAGKQQRADLMQRYPRAQLADDDPEQKTAEKDCGVRALVVLCIAKDCGLQCYMEL